LKHNLRIKILALFFCFFVFFSPLFLLSDPLLREKNWMGGGASKGVAGGAAIAAYDKENSVARGGGKSPVHSPNQALRDGGFCAISFFFFFCRIFRSSHCSYTFLNTPHRPALPAVDPSLRRSHRAIAIAGMTRCSNATTLEVAANSHRRRQPLLPVLMMTLFHGASGRQARARARPWLHRSPPGTVKMMILQGPTRPRRRTAILIGIRGACDSLAIDFLFIIFRGGEKKKTMIF
jgi:hypothetical protein